MGYYLKDRPWLTCIMDAGEVEGKCAACGAVCRERLSMLDDAYNVYRGVCPACKAVNLLDQSKGRGYDSRRMDLVLPTKHEMAMNKWPEVNIPLRPCDCRECRQKGEKS